MVNTEYSESGLVPSELDCHSETRMPVGLNPAVLLNRIATFFNPDVAAEGLEIVPVVNFTANLLVLCHAEAV